MKFWGDDKIHTLLLTKFVFFLSPPLYDRHVILHLVHLVFLPACAQGCYRLIYVVPWMTAPDCSGRSICAVTFVSGVGRSVCDIISAKEASDAASYDRMYDAVLSQRPRGVLAAFSLHPFSFRLSSAIVFVLSRTFLEQTRVPCVFVEFETLVAAIFSVRVLFFSVCAGASEVSCFSL